MALLTVRNHQIIIHYKVLDINGHNAKYLGMKHVKAVANQSNFSSNILVGYNIQ